MTITRMIPATLAGFSGKIDAELIWSPEVPVQVSASFTCNGEITLWCWSLELLRMGAVTVFPSVVGRCDVQVTTDHSSVVLFLRSPEGTATIALDYSATREFLRAVTLANLNEAEAMDALVDAFLVTLNEEAF